MLVQANTYDYPSNPIARGASLFAAPLRVLALIVLAFVASSCTLLSQSPHLAQNSSIPLLEPKGGLVVSPEGQVPYQRWRIPPWDDDYRYVWLVGNHDFSKSDNVELILYFHGMHSTDYYRAFRKELESLAAKRPDTPFLFMGFVDTPYVLQSSRNKNRWRSLTTAEGERPERLLKTVNRVFKAFRNRFPNVKKEKTSIVLAGFSGGGRVLDSVGNWLAQSPKEDPYAQVFLGRLSKIAYFDCWFDKDIVHTVPALLENNPGIKIVGTVHMEKPRKMAEMIAEKLRMKKNKKTNELVGLGGRMVIFQDKSHWSAMISRLVEAL